ncbi:MAG: DUF3473 domain-containing protein [Gammaproteobacteria bacterium]|nr:DUF3473 domain-containing protein [Gammaproteobacteria bacterium]
MSVDVEDYFQVSAFEGHIAREDWGRWPIHVERNTDRILALFAEAGVHATFFTLGWVAERFPQLVRRIVDSGHELACHGMSHVRVTEQDPATFGADIRAAKSLLEDVGGVAVTGYRAASYSIGRDNLWALRELADAGFLYSSSIYPIAHDLYGMPEASRFPFRPDNAPELLEIPISTARLAARNWPAGGGGYFRFLPYALSRHFIRRINEQEDQATVFYFHPWEIDTAQPRPLGLPLKTRVRHYLNQGRMESRLRRLLKDFRWGRMDEVFLAKPLPTSGAMR